MPMKVPPNNKAPNNTPMKLGSMSGNSIPAACNKYAAYKLFMSPYLLAIQDHMIHDGAAAKLF